ncbi:hypothetical protein [Microbulbifer rhizosphaerae]|uniref:Uncharacterized protein n=1 Tax=Microbulbifer rhizosphaerae TaxID=1562603 RepID=A0A7W4ZBB8_9GAMM|nr:hypothetical protein [Microbulbifer rhizosphaerae]MBB3063673.1 hypothetical protein [Microbulbifer rhizosphaerae]
MDLKISSDDDEVFLFERVVNHLQSSYGYSCDEAVRLVNEYYANFTDVHYCSQHGIPVQNADFFSHIEALGMADRVHYYQGLKNAPDEKSFIEWQRRIWK